MIAGIDVGGTKTHVCIQDPETGQLTLDQQLPTGSWATASNQERAEQLGSMVEKFIAPRKVTTLVAGVHGCDTEEQRKILHARIADMVNFTEVVNDSELVIPAAGLRSGSGIIAGTGSSITSHNSDGNTFTIGGWGWPIGDEGSASAIIRDAARAISKAEDMGEKDILSEIFINELGLSNLHEISLVLLSHDASEWASLAPKVFASAEAGSNAAQYALNRQIQGLIDLVGVARHRGGDIHKIIMSGGVLTGQPIFANKFSKAVRETFPEIRKVDALSVAPVMGALKLAKLGLTKKQH